MKKFLRFIAYFIVFILTLVLVLHIWAYFSTYQADKIQKEKIIKLREAPILKKGQELKVLSWNVQYMAGKNYVFFYDLLDGSGPDTRPSPKDIQKTTEEVARVIKEENPDIILIQEIDEGAARTDYKDQLANLLKLLPKEYAYHTSAWYWKASFVPHPKILGASGMKLSIISKYQITDAIRYQLPLIPEYWLMQQFNLKRAVLEAALPIENGDTLFVMNTHFSAFSQNTNTLQRQVEVTQKIMIKRSIQKMPFLVGGDFNLLASNKSYKRMGKAQQAYYQEDTELKLLFENFQMIPSLEGIDGKDFKKWFTHFPNDPAVKAPDRTIDYIFFSKNIKIGEHFIRQKDTWKISDHLPVIVTFQISE